MKKTKLLQHIASLIVIALLLVSYSVLAFCLPQASAIERPSENTQVVEEIVVETTPAPVVEPAPVEQKKVQPEKAEPKPEVFILTAYDLSEQSCERSQDDPDYGKTATGYRLADKSWDEARTIAVDPRVIPLGSKVRIHFLSKSMQQYDGVYTARDTGGGIRGHRIDFFMGDFHSNRPSRAALNFGVKEAEVTIL